MSGGGVCREYVRVLRIYILDLRNGGMKRLRSFYSFKVGLLFLCFS